METRNLLHFERKSLPYWLVMWVFFLPLLWGVLFSLFKLPDAIKYTADAVWVGLLLFMVLRPHLRVDKKTLPLMLLAVGFFLYALFLYLFNFQSLFYFLWGARNNFRFYVYFFAAIAFMQERDADGIFRILDIAFWINLPITLIQYFNFSFAQDDLGGIFGVDVGVNASTILLFTIVLSRSLLRYMEREEKFWLCAVKCSAALFISALAELKFFFVFFLIILVMAALLTSFSWRKLIVFILCALLVSLASSLLVELFGFEDFMSFEKIWQNATQQHYSSDKTVNRLSAIPTLAETVVPKWDDRWFGMGIGNCDTSAVSLFNTPFYSTYGYLRYNYFSVAFLFLEVGYVGLVLYVAFFTVCAFLVWRRIRRGLCNPLHGRIALIMAVLAHILVVYNSSLRVEIGYLVFLILALPFLEREDNPDEEDDSPEDSLPDAAIDDIDPSAIRYPDPKEV